MKELNMPEHTVGHSTFSLERVYDASPGRVFGAWSDPAAKHRWFAGAEAGHELDFRVGGREVTRGRTPDGDELTFESTYRDIVDGRRIVYASALSVHEAVVTVSITTIELHADGERTRR
jgi:uncharacterized protein YndB with AHSA1/START domain